MTGHEGGERRQHSRRDTVRRRLRRLVIGLLLLLVLTGVAGFVALQAATHDFIRLARGYAPAGDATRSALVYALDVQSEVGAFALTGQRSHLADYPQSAQRITDSIETSLRSLAAIGVHGLDQHIARERDLARQWLDEVVAPVAAGSGADNSTAAQGLLTQQVFIRFRAENSLIADSIISTRAALRDHALHRRDLGFAGIGIAVAVALLAGTAYGLRTARRLLRPLGALHDTVRRMERGDLTARTDAGVGPLEVRDVAGAVNRLGAQVEGAREAYVAAEELRRRTSSLSESLRLGVDPATMCQGLVVGLGANFAVDRVWLHTFDDNRVPSLTVQWHNPDAPPVPASLAAEVIPLRAMSNRLWHGEGLLAVPDVAAFEPPPGLEPFAQTMAQLRSCAAIFVPIGDGTSAMGLLVLASTSARREWTPTELSLVNRIGAELGHSLVQNNIVQRQHEVIEQLRDLDEAKIGLVSTVSHELRTPLTSISGYLEMVLDGDAGELPAEAVDMLRVVERNTQRLRNLIEDLLTQSRIEAGRLRLTVSRVDLREVIADLEAALRPIADANRVAFLITVPDPGEFCIEGDRRQLEQAFTNLLANAIKFTPAGGQVELTARPLGRDRVLVTIADTGIGIPSAELERLFDRFFRASNATEAEIPGTGLGLSIVREIIRAHQGHLEVESELGAGTTFRIGLACSPAESS